MQQSTEIVAPRPGVPTDAAPDQLPAAATRRRADDGPDSRPITVIGPPSFSPVALVRGVGRLAQYGDLLYTLTLHRLHVRYKQSVLGPLWAILQPFSLMLIYTAVFWRLARMESDGMPYTLFAYSALLVWSAFSTAVSSATNSLVSHFSLVTKVYFPREILPITYVLVAIADLAAGSVVLAGLMIYYGVPLTPQALYVAPILLVLTMFALAVSLVLCAVQVRYRDIGIAMPLVLQLWMFLTPVVYPLGMVPGALQPFYILNPMVGVIEGFRRVVIQGAPPHYQALAVSAAITFVLLPLAFIYFKHVESTVADVL